MDHVDDIQRTKRIAKLNDSFRKSFTGGRVVMTSGVASLDLDVRVEALRAVQSFCAFTPDNDPHGEHDFGFFKIEGYDFFWKIDYYDQTLSHHTEDATDPALTVRVLTIMLTEEY
jgi:hypothetical protein